MSDDEKPPETKGALWERALRVSRELNESTERLNETLREVEDRLHAMPTTPAMVRMPKSGLHLSWDGDFLWVIDRRSKRKLLDSARALRIEAAHVLVELATKAGVTLREPVKDS